MVAAGSSVASSENNGKIYWKGSCAWGAVSCASKRAKTNTLRVHANGKVLACLPLLLFLDPGSGLAQGAEPGQDPRDTESGTRSEATREVSQAETWLGAHGALCMVVILICVQALHTAATYIP